MVGNGKTWSVIRHGDLHELGQGIGTHQNVSTIARVAQSVMDQVGEGALDVLGVDGLVGKPVGDVGRQPGAGLDTVQVGGRNCREQDVAGRDPLDIELHGSRFEPDRSRRSSTSARSLCTSPSAASNS